MTTITADSLNSALPTTAKFSAQCECTREELGEGNFFRGIFIAVPAGLLMWAGALKLAGEIIRHF